MSVCPDDPTCKGSGMVHDLAVGSGQSHESVAELLKTTQGKELVMHTQDIEPYETPERGVPMTFSSKSPIEDPIANLGELAKVLDVVDENGYLPNNPAYSGPAPIRAYNPHKDRSLSGKARKAARKAQRKENKQTMRGNRAHKVTVTDEAFEAELVHGDDRLVQPANPDVVSEA